MRDDLGVPIFQEAPTPTETAARSISVLSSHVAAVYIISGMG